VYEIQPIIAATLKPITGLILTPLCKIRQSWKSNQSSYFLYLIPFSVYKYFLPSHLLPRGVTSSFSFFLSFFVFVFETRSYYWSPGCPWTWDPPALATPHDRITGMCPAQKLYSEGCQIWDSVFVQINSNLTVFCSMYWDTIFGQKESCQCWALVAHTCKPSDSGGRDQEDHSLKLRPGK
jgi:hypothetical protein